MNAGTPSFSEQEKLLYKLVFQFLIFNQGSHKLLEPHLQHIGKRIKSGAGLNDLMPELRAVSKTLLHISKQEGASTNEPSPPKQDDDLIQRIDELLDNAPFPMRLQQEKATLKRRLKSHGGDAFNQVIDSAITLLLDIKDIAVSEQKGIESFLSTLTVQLNDIEQQAETVGHANRASLDQRQQHNSDIAQRLGRMKDEAYQVQEIATLKTLTSDHLDRLMMQLLTHKEEEDLRQLQAEQKIADMTDKLQALETETEALRTRLKLEHDRALCDALTGLPNRLAYKDRLEMETNRWKRYRGPLSLAIWDVDYFKRINDNYGHKAGDKTLALVGQLLLNNCRATDFVARYGGEEFVMLMPSTQAHQALEMAENIREMIERCGFNHNGENINLTLSCGISEFLEGDLGDDAFVRADKALYQAKLNGRNRCEIYQSAFDASSGNGIS